MLTLERLKELMTYNPETGMFTRNTDNRKWKIGDTVTGKISENGYLITCVDYKLYRVHRLVWFYMTGEMPNTDVDHIDRNRLNNRFENLRLATRSENNLNAKRRKDNSSGHKNVFFNKRVGRWAVRIQFNKKQYHVGFFDTPEEANLAAIAYREKNFKKFHCHG